MKIWSPLGKKIELVFESEKGKNKLEEALDQKSLLIKLNRFIGYEELNANTDLRIIVRDDGQFYTEMQFAAENKKIEGRIIIVIARHISNEDEPSDANQKPCYRTRNFLKKFPVMETKELCKFCEVNECSDREMEFDKKAYDDFFKENWLTSNQQIIVRNKKTAGVESWMCV